MCCALWCQSMMNKKSSVFVGSFLWQCVVFVCSDVAPLPDDWSNLNFDPDGCDGNCPLCHGVCFKDEDCLGALLCFHRSDDTPIFGCKGGVVGDVPGYDYCAYAHSTVATKGTKGKKGCLSALPVVNIHRGHRAGFNLIGCFKTKTLFTVLTGDKRDNFDVTFELPKTNFLPNCKKQCASFCYMGVTGGSKLKCSCSNSPTWIASPDAVLGAWKCNKNGCEVDGGCGATNDDVQSVWSNGNEDVCVKLREGYWARPLSPGKFCSSTKKKKCSSKGVPEIESSAAGNKELCRKKCEQKADCGGYNSAADGECTLFGWSDDLKFVDSVTGGTSGLCDRSIVEEFSLIGCFPVGKPNAKGRYLFGENGKNAVTNDIVTKCKEYCKHTCYMAISGKQCFCSDNPQLGVPFSQIPDASCASNNNACKVKFGCGSSNKVSVYSNNELRSSKCKGKPIWRKTCSFQLGMDAGGVTFKSFQKTSAAVCQQECEKNRKCGCFTYMPGVCNLKPKGLSCVLKNYASSCAFISGRCSTKSEHVEGTKTSLSTATKSVNFGVMGEIKIQNADGGYLSVPALAPRKPNTVSETCSGSEICKWRFVKSKLSRKGFVAWNIFVRSGTTNWHVHIAAALKGLEDYAPAILSKCSTVLRGCSWVLEPIPDKTDFYYIRVSGGNTYLRKNGKNVKLDACDSKKNAVTACQWKVTGSLALARPVQSDAIVPYKRYSVRFSGTESWFFPKDGRNQGKSMIAYPCDKDDGWDSCYWYFEKSEASTGGQDVWYIKTSFSKTQLKSENIKYVWLDSNTKIAKLGKCNENLQKSPYRPLNCQWVLEEKGKNKYKIRNLQTNGYLQVTASKAEFERGMTSRNGVDVKYGECTDEAKCTWELTGVFPSRVAFDAMGSVKLQNVAQAGKFFHAGGWYKKEADGKYKLKIHQITLWECTAAKAGARGKTDVDWKWRCEYRFEKHDPENEDSNVWYIKQFNGRVGNSGKGPEAYVSVPADQQKETGVPYLGKCAKDKKTNQRPEECQWILEAVVGSVDTKFLIRNVAVSKKVTAKNLYLRKGSGVNLEFKECSDLSPASACQWEVQVQKQGFKPLCMPGPLKKLAQMDIGGPNAIRIENRDHFQDKSVDECAGLCHATKDCAAFIMSPGRTCWLKKNSYKLVPTSSPRNTYILTGSLPSCSSPQSIKKSTKVHAQPQPDFLLAGCYDPNPAPATNQVHSTSGYEDTIAAGSCMEICRDSCVAMIGWTSGKCVCSDRFPERKERALDHCGSPPYWHGSLRVAVFVNTVNIKCKSVSRPFPVSAAEKGTKECSMTVGMKGVVTGSSKNNRQTCSGRNYVGGFVFDAAGEDFECEAMAEQGGTAEECAEKCAAKKDCAGYMFGEETTIKLRSCALFNWNVDWKYELDEKHVTGTCDEKPAEPITLLGCYRKSHLTPWFSSTGGGYGYSNIQGGTTKFDKRAYCIKVCKYTCYVAQMNGKCYCANEMPSTATKQKQAVTQCNRNCDTRHGCGATGANKEVYVSVHVNNVMRLNPKCSKKDPWRRLCTKQAAVNVLGEDLPNGVAKMTAGACHQKCEGNSNCGCFKWDPTEGKCYQKKTKAAAKDKSKQCSEEDHEGMFTLISGTCT